MLVASKEEGVKRKAEKSRKPQFEALKKVEDEDREADKIARLLYGADFSKLPPFDVAVNTDRVPPELVARIVTPLREAEKREKF